MAEPGARPWFKLTADDALAALDSRRSGLTAGEARERRLRCGANDLPRKKKTPPLVAFLTPSATASYIVQVRGTSGGRVIYTTGTPVS